MTHSHINKIISSYKVYSLFPYPVSFTSLWVVISQTCKSINHKVNKLHDKLYNGMLAPFSRKLESQWNILDLLTNSSSDKILKQAFAKLGYVY